MRGHGSQVGLRDRGGGLEILEIGPAFAATVNVARGGRLEARTRSRLGGHATYAVRSSATAEDLPTASFATSRTRT